VRVSVLALALAAAFAGSASAATPPPKTNLLLTVADMPKGFHVALHARAVKASAEAREFGVKTARHGRVAGARVSFKRNVPLSDFTDHAINEVEIHLIFFRSVAGAHIAYKALVAKERPLFAVHVGAESAGSGLVGPDVNVRWVWWRHGDVVANVTGSYFGAHPSVRSLIALVRAQDSRLL
jgi:hypothetical protein